MKRGDEVVHISCDFMHFKTSCYERSRDEKRKMWCQERQERLLIRV
jgi:hypothetical protein